jgi:hypothetical protein
MILETQTSKNHIIITKKVIIYIESLSTYMYLPIYSYVYSHVLYTHIYKYVRSDTASAVEGAQKVLIYMLF